ncbi:hypothetical protein TNCV_3582141 [Trichonephila clavipes]|nr:hypothetical protein TNCV_3582141 [Trichonephila clavipes]
MLGSRSLLLDKRRQASRRSFEAGILISRKVYSQESEWKSGVDKVLAYGTVDTQIESSFIGGHGRAKEPHPSRAAVVAASIHRKKQLSRQTQVTQLSRHI